MLKLQNIVKNYKTGATDVKALKGVSIEFRRNEFVSILGQSGCGKTTLLNIIGGLDRYTSGDLEINGVSTTKFKDKDWDAYRNHSIGFVFQTYNLIPHQTVLANVELALTLSGVSKSERRRRAIEALNKVGLGDQIKKKPNQMSGGQMQRVAIARALVNNPDILLADEPTGALDSETSVQIMEILKEIAKDKLIIMVTHNPELAEQYSTRIVRLLDGNVIDDSDPYDGKDEEKPAEEKSAKKSLKEKKNKLKSMSFLTALSLSLNNLMTKRARTFMTSFAGSIGIIGIALILSLSNGVELYINSVEEDTLTSYPLAIEESTIDMTSMMKTMMGLKEGETKHELDKVYSNNVMTELMNAMVSEVVANNMKDFKAYLESEESGVAECVSGIQYTYDTEMNVYKVDENNGLVQVCPSQLMNLLGLEMGQNQYATSMSTASSTMYDIDAWDELLDNRELMEKQYEVLAGRLPESYDELLLIVNDEHEISDMVMYTIGLMDQNELKEISKAALNGEEYHTEIVSYTYDEILGTTYKLITNTDYYQQQDDGTWKDMRDDDLYMVNAVNNGITLKICGIVKPSSDSLASAPTSAIGYTSDLMKILVDNVNKSEIVKMQKENPDIDVFTGIGFPQEDEEQKKLTMEDLQAYVMTLPPEQQAEFATSMEQMQAMGMTEEKILEMFEKAMGQQTTDATYDGNMSILGVSDLDDPKMIMIYPKDFEAKEKIVEIIDKYNDSQSEENKINYTDYIGLLMSSVTTIINAISYILIAFVSISLVVSSIMIGIITYISVLERTKEIGILRAIGASKRDISRVFNAETLIVGFCSGAIGIGVTVLLIIPANIIIEHLTEIPNMAQLPWLGGVILVVISMLLTFIAGLFPSRIAAKKDPVVALRSE